MVTTIHKNFSVLKTMLIRVNSKLENYAQTTRRASHNFKDETQIINDLKSSMELLDGPKMIKEKLVTLH